MGLWLIELIFNPTTMKDVTTCLFSQEGFEINLFEGLRMWHNYGILYEIKTFIFNFQDTL